MSTKRSGSRIASSTSQRTENLDSSTVGSRQRQSKRDEAIRKKLEQELSKKRSGTSSTRSLRHTRKIAGTVSALRPAQALTVKENMLVIESAQLMAAKRADCVLVVDDDDHLSGIFTAKDLAYRVVAEDLDARSTTVAQIMTKGPMCVTADTSATDALNLMVSRGFRHLPVCNEEGDIFGLLDITKCLYEALDKMERAYGSSRKLYDALEGVEREWSASPVQLVQYMELLRDRMSCPDLNTVLDGTPPAEVSVKANVRDIAVMMKENHTTAVLVTKHHKIAGIFTSKDVVLRVIAAGLNPENCSVVRVMTPNPDTATPQTTIMEALRRMNDGHYLNLPVLDDGTLVGIVDVLKLTYATLEQINSIQGNDGEGSPMWSRFWDSFAGADHAESESQVSDSYPSHHPSTLMAHSAMHAISPEPSTSLSQLQGFSEILPNESASMVANNEDTHSSLSSPHVHHHADEGMFAFKFTTASGKTHRFTSACNSYAQLFEAVEQKVMPEHLAHGGHADDANDAAAWLSISYLDDEEDKVLMSSDNDVMDAVRLAQKQNQNRVKLFVHDAAIEVQKPIVTITPAAESAPIPVKQLESLTDSEEETKPHKQRPFSQDLLLPAAIAFLGVVVLGVFAVSRLSPTRN
ncbi:uncharacterized protein BYT42DRAFT_491092 [Radiomyces spectabilis]|uniref:uncharacterized protein n=1 Tax=Radiomyces spectabilis TaxID=64574 RepID=UPI00221E5CDE|nr:uncharacterized protein BYT42DRAFT_491092 [Radiomyces spectabilis]KAI8388755.1 hypothetical protein BYT42DRAFT_491092 [Radiomyces spectabilis]